MTVADRSVDAERWFLAGAMQRPVLARESGLLASDFSLDRHRIMFSVLLELATDNRAGVDPAAIILAARRHNPPPGFDSFVVSLLRDIGELVAFAPDRHYANLVLKASADRQLESAVEDVRTAQTFGEDTGDAIAAFQSRAHAIRDRLSSASDVQNVYEMAEAHEAHAASSRAHIRTGWPTLDFKLSEIGTGEVFTFAARTGVGKSTFALNWIHNILSEESDFSVLFVSLEMPARLTYARLLAMSGGSHRQLGSRLSRFIHYDGANVNVEQIPGIVTRAEKKAGKRVGIVFVDYLGALASVNPKDSTYDRVSSAAKRLKGIAKETDSLVVSLSQLSRQGEQHEPPSLSMLRESGVIEEASDYVVGGWRPDLDRSLSYRPTPTLMLTILKDRITGAANSGDITLDFDTRSLRLTEART